MLDRVVSATTATGASSGRTSVQKHPVPAFVLITFAISWGWWTIAYAVLGNGTLTRGLVLPGAFGPPIAAALVTWLSGGDVRAWASQITTWRVSPRWYFAAICLPIVLVVGGAGGSLALAGAALDPSVLPGRLPLLVVSFVVAALVGGGQEELGWRGFALPRLQDAYGALAASLAIGVVWAVWHLPLFLMGVARNQTGNFPLYVALVLGLSVLLTWCYNGTGGSVLLAMLFHGSTNASGAFLPLPLEALSEWPMMLDVGMVVGVWIAALAVIGLTDVRVLSRSGRPDSAIAGRVSDAQYTSSRRRSTNNAD